MPPGDTKKLRHAKRVEVSAQKRDQKRIYTREVKEEILKRLTEGDLSAPEVGRGRSSSVLYGRGRLSVVFRALAR